MAQASRHDSFQAGDSYERYMGRWSRLVAPRFLDWFTAAPGLDWLEIGCGTGALSGEIVDRYRPGSLLAIDLSEGFVAKARENVPDPHAEFRVGDAQNLAVGSGTLDVIVSGLVLSFIPDRPKAFAEMRRVGRRGARIGFYVWDYPGGGVDFMRAFWNAATPLDPNARDLTEDRRFPFCTQAGLVEMAIEAGLSAVESTAIEVPTTFRDFDDFWHPFTLGAGPAPGYCMSLDPAARERLRESLRERLPVGPDGSIRLSARAWAIKAVAA